MYPPAPLPSRRLEPPLLSCSGEGGAVALGSSALAANSSTTPVGLARFHNCRVNDNTATGGVGGGKGIIVGDHGLSTA